MLKKRKVPHTFVIVFYIILIAAIMTWFIPGGKYSEEISQVNGVDHKEMVFHFTENNPQTWQIFSALFDGFVDKSDIIVFILLIGGAFWIMNDSKAIDMGIFTFLRYARGLEKYAFLRKLGINNVIMVLIMLMFSVFGAVFGMSEETIAFIIILVPLAIRMGYDSITGVNLVFVAAGLGFAGAILNPFTIGIAQGIAELPLFSGIEYRMFSWLVINTVGFTYILVYAARVKKNPQYSPVYEDDAYWRSREAENVTELEVFKPKIAWGVYAFITLSLTIFAYLYPSTTLKIGNSATTFPAIPISAALFALTGVTSLRRSVHFFILNLLMFTILFLIIGVMGYGWYIMEIATLFFAMGLLSGIANNKNADEITKLFLEGVKDILSAALVVGLAGGIIIILKNGGVIDTILYYLAGAMNEMGKFGTVSVMYGIQTLINLVLPSGSAKAALTMPIMAPFSDLIGISRQATVMAYQLGDGFTNMITPTSGVLIAVLGVARIPYEKWFKWVWPLMVILILLGLLLLIPTVTMELNGF